MRLLSNTARARTALSQEPPTTSRAVELVVCIRLNAPSIKPSASAKMAVFGGGEPAGDDQVCAWEQARTIFDRFAAADCYLFSVPMWNAGVPYILKQWIDIITQPGWAFGFSPDDGYTGLIQGKKAVTIYTSGVYAPGIPPGFGQDFHSSFFDDWLRFIGLTDITEIRFQPTVLTANPEDDRAAAHAQARDAAKAF